MDKVVVKRAIEEIRTKLYGIEDEIVDLDEMLMELKKEVS
jgi:ppGpp synthetase/RelA/SpoT-type nucleotidyltranferase